MKYMNNRPLRHVKSGKNSKFRLVSLIIGFVFLISGLIASGITFRYALASAKMPAEADRRTWNGSRLSSSESTGSISGTVWLDSNSDGLINNGETGIGSRFVYLYREDTLVAYTETDESGNYAFTGLE